MMSRETQHRFSPRRWPSRWITLTTLIATVLIALAPITFGDDSLSSLDTIEKLARRPGKHHYRTGIANHRAVKPLPCNKRKRGCNSNNPNRTPSEQGGPLYWGATIGPQLTGGQAPWDMSAVATFEAMTKPLSIIHFFSPFSNCSKSPCSFYPFPAGPMQMVRDHGSIPMLSWASQSIPPVINQPDYQLSDVLAGTYDTYIHQFAAEARKWGHPFFLRFNWEMNGDWFPWMEGANGNRPGETVAVWRHVHDIFTEQGATNVTWVWCPNIGDLQPLSEVYPGDAYVDWTCLDGYNWGAHPERNDHWKSFESLYRPSYQGVLSVAPSKPMMIGEIGSTEYGGSKAAWHTDTLSTIPTSFPRIRALVWFERYDGNFDWPIETSLASQQAFATGIQNPLYLTNNFGQIETSPISAP